MIISLRTTSCLTALSLALSACAGLAQSSPVAPPPATEPPASVAPSQPSSTPAPTHPLQTDTPTPKPSPTASPTPTETPPPPTPDPNLNVGDEIYSDSFDGTSGWYWTFSDDVASFEAKDGELRVETKQGNSWRFVVRSDITAADQLLRVTTRTVTCPGNDEFGAMYRANFDADDKIHSYVFMLNCAGQARVMRLDDQTTTVVRDWETFAPIKPGAPAENALMIWMLADRFHFYVNEQYLFSLNDTALGEGFYGFYATSHSNGGGVMGFDDLTVQEVRIP